MIAWMKILLKLIVELKSKDTFLMKRTTGENKKHDKEKRTLAFENTDDNWKDGREERIACLNRRKEVEDKKDSCMAKIKRRMTCLS